MYSPEEILRRLDCSNFVSFHTENSLDYLSRCHSQYDFIFLDGLHSATQVYQEIPRALRVLRSGGYILLHDYFPGLEPLWPDGKIIRGPFLAVERLKAEGARVDVLPLGKLPWPTKLQSNITSLALLGSDSERFT